MSAALHVAAQEGHGDVLATLLEQKNMSVLDGVDDRGRSPLMYAAASNKTQCVKILLDADADPNHKDDKEIRSVFTTLQLQPCVHEMQVTVFTTKQIQLCVQDIQVTVFTTDQIQPCVRDIQVTVFTTVHCSVVKTVTCMS